MLLRHPLTMSLAMSGSRRCPLYSTTGVKGLRVTVTCLGVVVVRYILRPGVNGLRVTVTVMVRNVVGVRLWVRG